MSSTTKNSEILARELAYDISITKGHAYIVKTGNPPVYLVSSDIPVMKPGDELIEEYTDGIKKSEKRSSGLKR